MLAVHENREAFAANASGLQIASGFRNVGEASGPSLRLWRYEADGIRGDEDWV